MARAAALNKLENDMKQWTTNPTCTGSSLFAIKYKDGVVLAADKQVSYGKMNRYGGYSRLFRVNERCVLAFSGDHADFQFIQNMVETKMMEHQNEMNDPDADMSPKAVHAWLTWVLYYRRCKVDPLFNLLIVAGLDEDKQPFLATVNMRGVAYPQQYIATGLAAMLIQQSLENVYNEHKESGLDRQQAIDTMKEAARLQFYHDCVMSERVEVCTVDGSGVQHVQVPEADVAGTWAELADSIVGYE